MKKYVVLKGVGIAGTIHEAGDVVELNDQDAANLKSCGQVADHHEVKKPKNRSVGLKKSETKPKKRAK